MGEVDNVIEKLVSFEIAIRSWLNGGRKGFGRFGRGGELRSIKEKSKNIGLLQFNIVGSISRKNGISFAYHNHDYSFLTMDG